MKQKSSGEAKPFSHRKSKKRVRLLRSDGKPLAGETFRAVQVRHEFLFGCGGFFGVEMEGGYGPLSRERKKFLMNRFEKTVALNNFVTLPFYWGDYERVEGKPRRDETLAAARMFAERGVVSKGHPLCWHFVRHDWLMAYGDEEILARQLERIRREVGEFAGAIEMWDVINEAVIMPDFDEKYYDNPLTRVCKKIGRLELIKKVFAAAREASLTATLLINDFDTSPAYERLIEESLGAGVPINAIGIQTHQHKGYLGREKFEEILERFSRFKLPLHFTENTLVSGEIMPEEADHANYNPPEWPSTSEGEERQKREMLEIYELLFSHPCVAAVTNWEMADGGWLNAPAGFLRADNGAKPVYDALAEKINGEWRTEAELTTDGNGEAELYGFRGDYVLSADGRKASLTLDDKEELIQIVI